MGTRRQVSHANSGILIFLVSFLKQKTCVVDIVKHEYPFAVPLIAQPAVHKGEHVRLRVVPTGNSSVACKLADVGIKPCYTAGVHPECPDFW